LDLRDPSGDLPDLPSEGEFDLSGLGDRLGVPEFRFGESADFFRALKLAGNPILGFFRSRAGFEPAPPCALAEAGLAVLFTGGGLGEELY